MSFEEKFSTYKDCMPPGVRLPNIKVDKKSLTKLGISSYEDNFDLLKQLCRKGVKDLGIDKKENKKDYYERA